MNKGFPVRFGETIEISPRHVMYTAHQSPDSDGMSLNISFWDDNEMPDNDITRQLALVEEDVILEAALDNVILGGVRKINLGSAKKLFSGGKAKNYSRTIDIDLPYESSGSLSMRLYCVGKDHRFTVYTEPKRPIVQRPGQKGDVAPGGQAGFFSITQNTDLPVPVRGSADGIAPAIEINPAMISLDYIKSEAVLGMILAPVVERVVLCALLNDDNLHGTYWDAMRLWAVRVCGVESWEDLKEDSAKWPLIAEELANKLFTQNPELIKAVRDYSFSVTNDTYGDVA